jgi:hypothetical protein
MVEETFARNDFIPGGSGDLVELVSMLGDDAPLATVELHGLKSISRKDVTGNVSLANGQHGRVAAET